MSNRIITFGNLSAYSQELKVKYAKQSALDTLASKVSALEVVGGQANVLEGVKVNGTALAIADKMVDILVATGSENGTISVNGANVAVAGLQALAFKAQVSEADLDAALKAVLDAKASGADLTALAGRVSTAEGKLTTLIGEDADKSVRAISAEEVAKIVNGAPEAYDTLKELADWLSTHGTDAAAMNSSIAQNKADITALTNLVGSLPEGVTSTTVVDYIAEAIAGIGIGDYAKTSEVTAAINTALANYYTKTEMDTKLADYAKTSEVNAKLADYAKTADVTETLKSYATNDAVDTKLANYYNKTEMNSTLGNYLKSADAATTYVKIADVGLVSDAEVVALLAD